MKRLSRLSQGDYRWSRKNIGESNLTIGGYGCLITCIAMASGKTPLEVEDVLHFTDNDYTYGGGLMMWDDHNKKELHKMGLEYVGRYRGWGKEDERKMKELCQAEDFIPILEVLTKSGYRHWVLPIGRALTWRGLGWGVNDPWNGKREWKTVGFGAPYVKETGWLLFKRPEEE